MGDWRPLVILIIIFAIITAFFCSPARMLWDSCHQFAQGYEDGYNSFGDTYNTPDDFLIGKLRHEEGFWDYYYEPFWFQQGFEEGYKKAAREYWRE